MRTFTVKLLLISKALITTELQFNTFSEHDEKLSLPSVNISSETT